MGKTHFKPPKDLKKPTLEEFASMVEAHEPTWIWSMNPQDRIQGESERMFIDAARKALGDDRAVSIWNKSMHKKVVPSMLHEFLWTFGRRPSKA